MCFSFLVFQKVSGLVPDPVFTLKGPRVEHGTPEWSWSESGFLLSSRRRSQLHFLLFSQLNMSSKCDLLTHL